MANRATALADEIRGSRLDWNGANELHEALVRLAGIPEAVADLLRRFGDELDDRTNLRPSYPEAVHEAAARIGTIAKELDGVTGDGLIRSARSPSAPMTAPPATPDPSPVREAPRGEPDVKPTAARPWVTGPAPLPAAIVVRANPSGFPARPPAPSPGMAGVFRPETRRVRRGLRKRARRAWRRAQWS